MRDARKRARARETNDDKTQRERERVKDRSHPSLRRARTSHLRKRNRGIGNNSKKFQTRLFIPSQTLRVWIFLCFFNQRIFSILAVSVFMVLAGGGTTTEEVILVLGDVSRQVVGRVHERELFRQVLRVCHFFTFEEFFSLGKGKRKILQHV